VIKKGRTPLTYYALATEGERSSDQLLNINDAQREVLQKDFMIIKKDGRRVTGDRAVYDYAEERNENPMVVATNFLDARQEQQDDGEAEPTGSASTKKQLSGTDDHQLDNKLESYDFVDYDRIGEVTATVLSQKLQIAKKSQDRLLQLELYRETEQQLQEFIINNDIDAVAFVPGSTRAGIEFIEHWRETLNIPLPHVRLVRTANAMPIPIDSIALPKDREQYASYSVEVHDHRTHQHVLIIDDEVKSGTTVKAVATNLLMREVALRTSAFSMIYRSH